MREGTVNGTNAGPTMSSAPPAAGGLGDRRQDSAVHDVGRDRKPHVERGGTGVDVKGSAKVGIRSGVVAEKSTGN
jgi:hypothetical protein